MSVPTPARRRLLWPRLWPGLALALALAILGLLAAGWVAEGPYAELEFERSQEARLRSAFAERILQAVNLPAVRSHHAALAQQQAAVAAARPMSFNEFAVLVERHGLRLERLEVSDSELAVRGEVVRSAQGRITGDFRRFGAFAEAVAASPAAFALRDQVWTALPAAPGIALECTIDIYRPMSAEEREAERAKARALAKAKSRSTPP